MIVFEKRGLIEQNIKSCTPFLKYYHIIIATIYISPCRLHWLHALSPLHGSMCPCYNHNNYFGDDDWIDTNCNEEESKNQVMPDLCSELTQTVIDHVNRSLLFEGPRPVTCAMHSLLALVLKIHTFCICMPINGHLL